MAKLTIEQSWPLVNTLQILMYHHGQYFHQFSKINELVDRVPRFSLGYRK